MSALVALLTTDAVLEMPPVPLWYVGRTDYGKFMARVFALRGSSWRVLQTSANRQPALAAYVLNSGTYQLHTLQVFTVGTLGIERNVVFQDAGVFSSFGLAQMI